MKKIMLTLLALLGLVAFDATAGYRRCYRRCEPCPKYDCPVVERACPSYSCKVDRIVEQPCPDVPCCVRYVKVEEPALITKHISYSWECPTGCTAEQKAAGMMHAGESGTFAGAATTTSY